MAARKSERIVNLTICLLSTRRFLPKEQIRQVVDGYADLSDAAFERTFERDKDELRSLGVPIEVGTNEALFDDEVGYRIRRTDFELPAVEFTPDELTVLGAAARVWQQASVAEQTVSALTKLRAAGVEPDVDRLAALEPAVSAKEPAFEALWQATLARRRVEFRYRGAEELRVLEPWSINWRRGAWYVLGRDVTRDKPRLFKMARISSQPRLGDESGAYTVPEVDLGEISRRLEPQSAQATAIVAVRRDHAPVLRRAGEPVDWPATVAPVEGFECYRVPYAQESDLVADVCAAGVDALLVEPARLRAQVLAQLTCVAREAG